MKLSDVIKKLISSFGYILVTLICLLQFYFLTDKNGYIDFLTDAQVHGGGVGLEDLSCVGLWLVIISYLIFFICFQRWYWSSKEEDKPTEAYVLATFISMILPFASCCCMLIILGDGMPIFFRIFVIIQWLLLILTSCIRYSMDAWKKKVCSNCGEEIGEENYCSNCGVKIDKE